MRTASLLLVSLATVFGLASPLSAQPLTDLLTEPPTGPLTQPAPDLGLIASRELTKLGLIDLRLQDSPTPADLALLDSILGLAQQLDPDNEELVRRRIELAYRLGDGVRLEARTRELIQLDPKDTVAQLRLISANIAKLQTVDARMKAYSRYLSPAGQKIDPAIRSRLALDAALLAREQGDDSGFTGLLIQAVQLDATNKDAAALAATFFSTRIPDDPAGQLELSINLLLADPIDPHVHMSIAHQLARVGAFGPAMRFHGNASRIFMADAGQLSESLQGESLVLAWQTQGPEVALQAITDSLANERYAAAIQIQSYEKEGIPTLGLQRPEDIRLTETMMRIHVLSAHSSGDQESLAQALGEIAFSLQNAMRLHLNPQDLPPGKTIESVDAEVASLELTLFLFHAWTGFNMEAIAGRFRAAPAIFGDDAIPMLRAFAALYADGPEDAEQRFRDLLDEDPIAYIGLGLALERQNRLDEAVVSYSEVARRLVLQPEGAWARSRAVLLSGKDVLLRANSQAMANLTAGVPGWVDRMIVAPGSAMQIELRFVNASVGPLEPILLEVLLRNVTPEPLGLGGDRPIQSRLLISPTIDVGIQERILAALPEVLDIERRLRLAPREEVVATIEIAPAFTGWYLDTSIESTARVSVRVLQGFRQSATTLTAGPLALTGHAGPAMRIITADSRMSASELTTRIAQASEAQLPYALLAARMLLVGVQGELPEEDTVSLVRACADRYPSLSPESRAVAILILPSPRLVPEMQVFEDELMASSADETDPIVLAAIMLVHVTTADDPLLALDAITSDRALATIADGIRARADQGASGYAGAGPKFADLMPRTLQSPGG